MLIRNLFYITFFLLAVGCSTLKSNPVEKEFVINRSWARYTPTNEYTGARINHIMAPVLYKEIVIVGNEIDGIAAYEQKSGREVWHRRISGGVTSSAALDENTIFFGAGDGYFYALSAETGKTRWVFPLKAEGLGAPLVAQDTVYFLAGNSAAYALNKNTGEQVWYYGRQDAANISVRGASEPSIFGEQIFFGFSDGYLVSLNKSKGTVLWERQLGLTARFRDVDSRPVIDGDRIYVSSYDGQLYCLKAQDGQTIWTHDDGGFLPVTIVGERLFYSTSTRKVMALEKSSGKVLWSLDLRDQVASQPSVTKGILLFGEWGGRVKAVDERTGRPVAYFNTGRGVTSRVTIAPDGQRLFVMSADANLWALNLVREDQQGLWPWEKN